MEMEMEMEMPLGKGQIIYRECPRWQEISSICKRMLSEEERRTRELETQEWQVAITQDK